MIESYLFSFLKSYILVIQLKIFNIWENGSLYWKSVKMFPNRMQNLAGRVLKATSFEYRPFIYKENPGDKRYQGYEVPSWNYCM